MRSLWTKLSPNVQDAPESILERLLGEFLRSNCGGLSKLPVQLILPSPPLPAASGDKGKKRPDE